jgi:PEGA domain-containing protein
MMTTIRNAARTAGLALLAVGISSSVGAWARQGAAHAGHAGHAGGGGYHARAAGGHVAVRGTASGGAHYGHGTASGGAHYGHGTASGVARYGHGTASGIAHYGHGYGYPYYGYGYPYYWYPWWGGWYPWWGVGWYGSWGWGGYGYAGYYGPYYDTDVGTEGSYAPAPQGPATIETGVSPAKAEVVLDGEAVGFASDYNGRWDELTVAPGQHTITFRAKGYRSLVVDLEARPGATYKFHDALAPGEGEEHRTLASAEPPATQPPQEANAPGSVTVATGRLRIHAEPPDAAVYLDGEYLGMAGDLDRIHGSLAVAAGKHRLEVVRPGFASTARSIDVEGTAPATVELRLEPDR